jgi:RNA polymerase sigma-70 factor (ECF subfamily)
MTNTPLSPSQYRADLEGHTDVALVALARTRSEAAIRTLIKRHNQRLFRVARAIVRNDTEAEDVVQASYVNAFTHLASFRGDSELSTWLTRITINEATERLRRRQPTTGLEHIDLEQGESAQIIQFPTIHAQLDPETEMSRQEIRLFIEEAVDALPDAFRAVFVLRDVEGLSVEEAASYLNIKPQTVRTRLHRARRLMRSAIEEKLTGAFASLFPFDGERCVHMADRVLLILNPDARQPESAPQ